MKRFTLREAEALIPELERVFESIAEVAAQAELKARRLRERQDAGAPDPVADAIERAQLQFLAQGLDERLRGIVELGALPKGVEPALVDFPAVIDGREAYLCWKLGETRIGYWHGTDEGFASRKPLPRRERD
ncbi:MAG: DUF2203 domain-containing protein [Elusimicrobiota bacterium]|nr:DUF2203 domain-containing protein [Elusimicrobiota bacterium]